MTAMTTNGSVPPAVQGAGPAKKPKAGKKGVNPFAKKGMPSKMAAGPGSGKKPAVDPKTLASMKDSLNFK